MHLRTRPEKTDDENTLAVIGTAYFESLCNLADFIAEEATVTNAAGEAVLWQQVESIRAEFLEARAAVAGPPIDEGEADEVLDDDDDDEGEDDDSEPVACDVTAEEMAGIAAAITGREPRPSGPREGSE